MARPRLAAMALAVAAAAAGCGKREPASTVSTGGGGDRAMLALVTTICFWRCTTVVAPDAAAIATGAPAQSGDEPAEPDIFSAPVPPPQN